MRKHTITLLFLASTALVGPACVDQDSTTGPGAPPAAVSGLRTIRTFDDWLDERGVQLAPDQEARRAAGQAVLGLVPADELPVYHRRAGLIEMTDEMFDRVQRGELDFRTDFQAWVDAGLFDPHNHEQRQRARDYLIGTGVPPELAALELPDDGPVVQALMVAPEAAPEVVADPVAPPPPPPPEWNCRYVITINATQPNNNPAVRTTTPATTPCANFGGFSASHFVGAAPFAGASANGGFRNTTGVLDTICTQLAQTQGSSSSSARAGFTWTTEAADARFPMRCPGPGDWQPQFEVNARGQAKLVADLSLSFRKSYIQWNPIGVFWRGPWKGVAAGSVEAYVNDSAWKRAIASGEVQVGSNCTSTFSGSFSATAGGGQGGGNVTVGPSAGVWYTCDTQAWQSANNARNQALNAEVQDVPVTLRNGQSISVGVMAQNFKAEAWSTDPAEGAPWAEVWHMQSRADAAVRGGCMVMAFEGCNIPTPPYPGLSCRLDGAASQAWYSTSTGVTCPGFAALPQ